jgi:hypothetical protein
VHPRSREGVREGLGIRIRITIYLSYYYATGPGHDGTGPGMTDRSGLAFLLLSDNCTVLLGKDHVLKCAASCEDAPYKRTFRF